MKITQVRAHVLRSALEQPFSFSQGWVSSRGATLVEVQTDDGITGWGEAHHARGPGSIGHFINTTLSQLIRGMDASDVIGIWSRIYKFQLGSHGMGAACAMAMSGIDMALWDIRGKAVGWPLCRMLGGAVKPVKAYAGGVSLGWQDPAALVDEARPLVEKGYKAVKLRVGDTPARDLARIAAVRKAVGDGIDILTDANTAYSVKDARAVMPGMTARASFTL